MRTTTGRGGGGCGGGNARGGGTDGAPEGEASRRHFSLVCLCGLVPCVGVCVEGREKRPTAEGRKNARWRKNCVREGGNGEQGWCVLWRGGGGTCGGAARGRAGEKKGWPRLAEEGKGREHDTPTHTHTRTRAHVPRTTKGGEEEQERKQQRHRRKGQKKRKGKREKVATNLAAPLRSACVRAEGARRRDEVPAEAEDEEQVAWVNSQVRCWCPVGVCVRGREGGRSQERRGGAGQIAERTLTEEEGTRETTSTCESLFLSSSCVLRVASGACV